MGFIIICSVESLFSLSWFFFFGGGARWRAGGLFHLYGNRLHRKVEVYYVTWQHDVLYFTSFLQPLLVAARRIIFRQMALSFFSITIHFPTLSLMGNKLSVIFSAKGSVEMEYSFISGFCCFRSLALIY